MTEDLFDSPPPLGKDDKILVAAYSDLGRQLDDLPYTDDMIKIFSMIGKSEKISDVGTAFRRLLNLRKAGRLPRLGVIGSAAPQATRDEEQLLADLVRQEVGTLGQRDQLPYSPNFDRISERFSTMSGRSLDKHSIWRLIAKIAK